LSKFPKPDITSGRKVSSNSRRLSSTHARMYVSMYVCTYVCMYVRVYVLSDARKALDRFFPGIGGSLETWTFPVVLSCKFGRNTAQRGALNI
jgi:hypothetical protein